MAAETHVLVTGSTGNLGEKAVAALRAVDGVRVSRIGRDASGAPDVIAADLAIWDRAWAASFAGVDAVLHLAADPRPIAAWESVARLNVDLSLNVLRAAEEGRVARFVFASSNWVLGGYRFARDCLAADTPPRPVNPYGASKLLIERVGLAQAARTGMAFLSLRIGYCQPGENRPGPHMAYGRWGQEMWLSNEDWAAAVVRACTSPHAESAVLNIMSRNEGMRWDLEAARRAIGYVPVSQHVPRLTAGAWLCERLAQVRDAVFPQMSSTPRFGSRW